MRDKVHPSRSFGAAVAALMMLCAVPLLAGCAANSYAGIPFAAGAADPELQGLAMRAQVGDKQAQLDLGIRYEEGRGVPVDLRRAERLYRDAAHETGGATYVYNPPISKDGTGHLVRVDGGTVQTGLLEAQVRLRRLLKRSNAIRRNAVANPENE